MIQIVPNLFIGNDTDAKEFADVVDIVINCTKDIPFFNKKHTPIQIRVPVNDDGCEESMTLMKSQFKSITTFIKTHINTKSILVHCKNGQQRSATIIAAYLMSLDSEKSFDQLIEFIKQHKRDAFFYQINFRQPLQEYFNELKHIHPV